jgi:hypothetical protein
MPFPFLFLQVDPIGPSMEDLLNPPPALVQPQQREGTEPKAPSAERQRVSAELEGFITGVGGVVPPGYGATFRVMFPNGPMIEVTGNRTQPPTGDQPFTSFDAKVRIPIRL